MATTPPLFQPRMTTVPPRPRRSTWYIPAAITLPPARKANGILACKVCAEAAPAATRAAAAIINFVVNLVIVKPSFGFAAAFPITGVIFATRGPAVAGPPVTAGSLRKKRLSSNGLRGDHDAARIVRQRA